VIQLEAQERWKRPAFGLLQRGSLEGRGGLTSSSAGPKVQYGVITLLCHGCPNEFFSAHIFSGAESVLDSTNIKNLSSCPAPGTDI
jgi:hypothetical protein